MKYKVLDSFKAVTSQGEMELKAGQVITLPHDKALALLNERKITPIEKVAYRIYSDLLEDYLWTCETDEDLHYLRSENITEAVYTAKEIRKLKSVGKEHLKAVHEIKTVFENSKIEECKKNEKEV